MRDVDLGSMVGTAEEAAVRASRAAIRRQRIRDEEEREEGYGRESAGALLLEAAIDERRNAEEQARRQVQSDDVHDGIAGIEGERRVDL